jgi:hypothetical protein
MLLQIIFPMLIIIRRWLTLKKDCPNLFRWRSPSQQSRLSGNGTTCWKHHTNCTWHEITTRLIKQNPNHYWIGLGFYFQSNVLLFYNREYNFRIGIHPVCLLFKIFWFCIEDIVNKVCGFKSIKGNQVLWIWFGFYVLLNVCITSCSLIFTAVFFY